MSISFKKINSMIETEIFENAELQDTQKKVLNEKTSG